MDLFFLVLAIYRTGADKSLLFFLSVIRVSDQTYTSFKRLVLFAHLSLFSYVLFILYLTGIERRTVDWKLEILKMAYIYGANMYIAVTSKPAEKFRKRSADITRQVRRLNRQLIRNSKQLEDAKLRAEAINEGQRAVSGEHES